MSSYGLAKRRDMARSVLPSSRRVGARWDKAHLNRVHRRTVRRATNQIESHYDLGTVCEQCGDYHDWHIDCDTDLTERGYNTIRTADRRWRIDMGYAVDERRTDKLAALYRWAPTQVNHIRLQDRLTKMKTIMPDTVPGRHAIGHLEGDEAFRVEHPSYWRYYQPRDPNYNYDEDKFIRACRAAQIIDYITWVWENGLIGVFNRFLAEPDIERGGIDDPGYPPITRRDCKDSHDLNRMIPRGEVKRWVDTNLAGHRGYRDEPNYTLGKKLIHWFESNGMPVL